MKCLIQRVSSSSVTVDGEITGAIELGLNILVGFGREDSEDVMPQMADKISNLRIFPDEKGRFHHSVLDVNGGILLVPQFTLLADTRKGRRPDFFGAMPPETAEKMFDKFRNIVRQVGVARVETGVFGAHMHVSIENDGPVTIMLEV